MTSVLLPASRPLARALPTALSLLALPALAVAQDASDPLNLGYESATESHRRFDDEARGAEGGTPADRAMATPDVEREAAVMRAGDRPLPLDPQAARDQAPDGAKSQARARALGHDSVLEGYAPYEPSEAPNWVGANDTVGEIGGWRTYAREAFEADEQRSGAVEPEAPAIEPAIAAEATPADERTPTTRALVHESALEDYTAYEASDGPNWIEANRVVGEIGGWRTYARELFESGEEGGGGR